MANATQGPPHLRLSRPLSISSAATLFLLIAFSLPLPWAVAPVVGAILLVWFVRLAASTPYQRMAWWVIGALTASVSQVTPLRLLFQIDENTFGELIFGESATTIPAILAVLFTLLVVLDYRVRAAASHRYVTKNRLERLRLWLEYLFRGFSLIVLLALSLVVLGFPTARSYVDLSAPLVQVTVCLATTLMAIVLVAPRSGDSFRARAVMGVAFAAVLLVVAIVSSVAWPPRLSVRGSSASAPGIREASVGKSVGLSAVTSIESLRSECEILTPDFLPVTAELAEVHALVIAGNESFYAGMIDEAIRRYKSALILAPSYADGWHNLGIIYLNTDLSLAAQTFGKAAALRPNIALFRRCEGFAYRELGNWERALEACRKAVANDGDDGRAWFQLGLTLLDLGDIEHARDAFEHAHKCVGNDTDILLCLAHVLKEENRDREAESYLRTALARDPANCDVLSALGNLLVQDERASEALAHFTRAAALRPLSAREWQCLGVSQKELEFLDDARQAFARSIALNDTYLPGYVGLVDVLCRQELWAEARAVCQTGLKLDRQHPDLLALFGRIELNLGEVGEAQLSLMDALRLDPDNHRALEELARAHEAQGEFRIALEYARRALQTGPDCVRAYETLAEILLQEDTEVLDPKSAERVLRQALLRFPGNHQFVEYLASALIGQGRFEEAVVEAQQAVDSSPDCIPGRLVYATALRRARKFDRAIREYETVLASSEVPADIEPIIHKRLDESRKGLNRTRLAGWLGPGLAITIVVIMSLRYFRMWRRERHAALAFEDVVVP